MNIKYTTDGKKVLVVGKLNAEQSIVQEVFISAGQEIPSGENFVVTSLHDAPVESWKEKHLRESEAQYERRTKELERDFEARRKQLTQATDKAKLQAAALFAFAKNSNDEQLNLLRDFISGELTHFFADSYKPEILTWDGQELYQVDSWGGSSRIEELRIISVFGKVDGNLHYKLGQYSDGSGNYKYELIPCRSYAEALAKAQEKFDFEAEVYLRGDKSYFDLGKWERIKDIKVPDAVSKKIAAHKQKEKEKTIAELTAKLEALKNEAV